MTDQEIVEGICRGGIAESKAIGMLCESNKNETLSFINRMSSQENAKEPEDIIWEGIKALVNNIKNGRYKIQENIQPY